jgi:hypothetical protein
MTGWTIRLVVLASLFVAPARAFAGTVQGVTANPSSRFTGQAVSVTVTGTNPCGAAHVNWGDGTAITYAITGLPTTQSHAYEKGGSYRIVARGMGNCDGEAATTVEIKAPAPPPPPPPPPPPNPPAGRVTAVTFSSTPATVRQPVTIAVDGEGVCAFTIDYGDGNQQNMSGALPKRITHTYGAAGAYRVIVGPVGSCTGKFTETLQVLPRGGASINGVRATPSPASVREAVSITVLGVGTCSYTIEFGDGNTEERTKPLPDAVTHVYAAPDTYGIHVQAVSGCTGSARRALTVLASVPSR